jgi:hypothetical protein
VANALYPLWKQSLMTASDLNNGMDGAGVDAPYLALVAISPGYVYSAAHQFYTALSNVQGTDQPILTNTVAGGVFKGGTVVFVNVTGAPVGALVVYRHNSGVNSSWRLVMYEDTGVVGFPVSANGGNVIVTWDTQGIFQL